MLHKKTRVTERKREFGGEEDVVREKDEMWRETDSWGDRWRGT